MKPITLYAIRRRNTEQFIISVQGRSHTSREPMEIEPVMNRLPRLFPSRHAARCALTAWTKGHWYLTHDGEPACEKRSYRDPNDMEIVEFTLTIP